jgi:hypothetical protein
VCVCVCVFECLGTEKLIDPTKKQEGVAFALADEEVGERAASKFEKVLCV